MSNEEKISDYVVTNEEVFDTKLCRAIEVFPCLYDTNSKLYRNRKTCDAAWLAISKRCNETIINCKRRWIELYKIFVLNNFDKNTSTELKEPTDTIKEKEYLNECLKYLLPHIPLRLEQLWDDCDKVIKEEHDLDNNTNEENVVVETNQNVASEIKIESEVASIQTINESETNANTPCNTSKSDDGDGGGDGNADKSANASPISLNNKSPPGPINIPTNCQSKVETFIIKSPDWNNKNIMPITTIPNVSPILVASHVKNNNAPITKVNILETEEEGKRYNFRRSCKRPPNSEETITSEVTDKRKKTSLLSSFDEVNYRKSSPLLSPPRKLEVKVARMSLNKKLRPLRPIKYNESHKLNDSPPYNNNSKQYDDRNIPSVKKLSKDSCIQTEIDSMLLDNDFLNNIRIQMNLMNSRQSLHFKFKVYKALMEVFDDASNFPKRNEIIELPATGAPRFDTTTTAELQLMRELVALVQAAKQSAISTNNNSEAKDAGNGELLTLPESPEHTADNTLLSSYTPKVTNSILGARPVTTASASAVDTVAIQSNVSNATPTGNDMSPPARNSDEDGVLNVPRHIIRKVVKVGGVHGGTLMTQDGDKKRIYRIYPKISNNSVSTSTPATQRITYSQSASHSGGSGSGTFFITQTSPSSATGMTSISSTTASHPSRTMLMSNNRGSGTNNLTKSVIMRSVDGSRSILSGSGSQTTIISNNNNNSTQRSGQIRFSQPPQMMRRYSISSSNGSTINVKTNLTNGINHSNSNMGSIQKMTVLTTTAATASCKYRTIVSNRRVPITNIIRANADMPMIRSVRSIANTSQSSTFSSPSSPPPLTTTTLTGNNSISNTSTAVNTTVQTRSFISQKTLQQQQQQQQQHQQQQLPKLFTRMSNNAETVSDEPLQVNIKTEPED